MNSELQVFSNSDFGAVRTIVQNGDVWFVGRGVAEILGYAKPLNALSTHVDKDDTLKQGVIDSLGRTQDTILINESGLYSLILSSKMPNAKQFKHWVTSEILPSIRKNGGYIANQETMTPEQIVANALVVAHNIIDTQKKQLAEQTQRADIAEQTVKRIEDDKGCYTMNQTAKALKLPYGDKTLFKILREDGILNGDNTPKQKQMPTGRFKVVTKNTSVGRKPVTLVTGKGLVYLAKRFNTEIDTSIKPDKE